jgi:hypothetical protein
LHNNISKIIISEQGISFNRQEEKIPLEQMSKKKISFNDWSRTLGFCGVSVETCWKGSKQVDLAMRSANFGGYFNSLMRLVRSSSDNCASPPDHLEQHDICDGIRSKKQIMIVIVCCFFVRNFEIKLFFFTTQTHSLNVRRIFSMLVVVSVFSRENGSSPST